MLLCGVSCTMLSVLFGAIVQIIIFLLQNSNVSRVQASLPPGTEDEIIVIEHLPRRRVHLQDFFWTNAQDAPPWVDFNRGLTFYETKTTYHTVTLYSTVKDTENQHPDSYDPRCTTCIEPTPTLDDTEDQHIGVIIEEDPGPRYWLLTVLRTGEAIPPKIELKLARLYRAAFSRQQQRHLGLLQTDLQPQRLTQERTFIRSKPEISTVQEEMSVNSAISPANFAAEINSKFEARTLQKSARIIEISKVKNSFHPTSNIDDTGNYNNSIYEDDALHSENSSVIEAETLNESTTFAANSMNVSENGTPYVEQQHMGDTAFSNLSSITYNLQISSKGYSMPKKQISNVIEAEDGTKHSKLRLSDYSTEGIVQVRMQNASVTEGGTARLIYSVHLGGKPVLAETAARDMALLSPQEVALELGAPVLIQSEPYLKESKPLALSRKRDAWLLIGAAAAGFILLAFILAGLIFMVKRKRTHSAIAVPSNHSTLKKLQDSAQESALENVAFSTPQMENKTDGPDHRETSGSMSRTPGTSETDHSLNIGIQEFSNDDKKHEKITGQPNSWNYSPKETTLVHGKVSRSNAIDTSRTADSTDVVVDHLEILESPESSYMKQEEEAAASPRSYLSMPSCKQFPNVRGVEPLCRVLEPVMVKHLDIDSPEVERRDSNHVITFKSNESNDKIFTRTSSAIKDPGVVGPLVWNLRRQALSTEANDTSGTDEPFYVTSSTGPVGRARRRLHDLLEDSFSLFGSRDLKSNANIQQYTTQLTSATYAPDFLSASLSIREKSAHTSPVSSPTTKMNSQSRTPLSKKHTEQSVEENKPPISISPPSGWGSRPLSAGPFHRPHLPNVDTKRVLMNCQLPPEDPAVPLIASIKKELERFSSQ